jgi:hypothetical protein
MAKFCEKCPLRGECTDIISYVDFADFESFTVDIKLGIIPIPRRGIMVTLEECVDINNRSSRLFQDVNPADPPAIIAKIENCDGPTFENRPASFARLERARTIIKCGALGIGPNALGFEDQLRKIRNQQKNAD